jgi:hypothetical protein
MNKEQAQQAAEELLNLLPRKEMWKIHVDSTFNDKDKEEHDFYIATDGLMACPAKDQTKGKYKVHGFGQNSFNNDPVQAIKNLFKYERSIHKKALAAIEEAEETLFPIIKYFVDQYPQFFDKDPAVYIEGGWDGLVMEICSVVERLRNGAIMLLDESFEAPTDGLFNFKFRQIKEKYASLTIYYDISEKKLDWSRFCKEGYDIQFARAEGYIKAVIDQAEQRSNTICEYTGKPGRHYSVNGWGKILCEEKARELGAI